MIDPHQLRETVEAKSLLHRFADGEENLSHFKNWFRGTSVYGAASMTVDADVMMGRQYTNFTRIPVYVVLEKVATGKAAARLVAATKFVVALECFDFR